MSKDYFKPGDVVRINKDVPNRPMMVVEKIEKVKQVSGAVDAITGIKCFWYDKQDVLQRAKFNFKDLERC